MTFTVYPFLAAKVFARDVEDENLLAIAMREYGDLRVAECLAAQQPAHEADAYATYQLSLPLSVPAAAACGGGA